MLESYTLQTRRADEHNSDRAGEIRLSRSLRADEKKALIRLHVEGVYHDVDSKELLTAVKKLMKKHWFTE